MSVSMFSTVAFITQWSLQRYLRVEDDLSKATLLETLNVSTVRRDRIGK